MKKSFNLEVFKTNKTLTTKKQETFRLKFKPFLNLDGIMSLCLEEEYLYVEFDQSLLNLDSFKRNLTVVEFPLERKNIKLAS